MQPRQHRPLETRKVILLAKTEVTYFKGLLSGINDYLQDKLPEIQAFQDELGYYEFEVKNLMEEYNALSDSKIRFNEQERLDKLYQVAISVRGSLTTFHQKLTSQIVAVLQLRIVERKKAIQNTLADSCDYKRNIELLHSSGQLTQASMQPNDYTDLQYQKIVLRNSMQYLKQLTFTFVKTFPELQERISTDLRHAGLFKEHLATDKELINKTIEAYKSKLATDRQTIIGIHKELFSHKSDTYKAIAKTTSIMESVNPIQRLPYAYSVSQDELKTQRSRTLSDAEVEVVRIKHAPRLQQ